MTQGLVRIVLKVPLNNANPMSEEILTGRDTEPGNLKLILDDRLIRNLGKIQRAASHCRNAQNRHRPTTITIVIPMMTSGAAFAHIYSPLTTILPIFSGRGGNRTEEGQIVANHFEILEQHLPQDFRRS